MLIGCDLFGAGNTSLDGSVHDVEGVLPMTHAAHELGYRSVFVPQADAAEAARVEGIDVYPVETLGRLAAHFRDRRPIEPYRADLCLDDDPLPYAADFLDIKRAEVRKMGMTADRVVVSPRVNVPDGGVDAEVTEVPGTVDGTIIRGGVTSYQIKTGSSFSPWQPAEIRRELFGEKAPSREDLASHVRRCLDRDGTYILVCFGLNLTPEEHQLAICNLQEHLTNVGYRQPKVDVWSISNLLGFLQIFPGLALRVNGRFTARFETHQEWADRADMQTAFNAGDAQLRTIATIQAELRRDPPVHIRVWGEPGIGKTRLVLEATGADDLRPLVIYTTATTFRDSDLMAELLRGEFDAVLVVDECDPDDRATIWNRFKHHPGVKLISIYTDHELVSDVVDCTLACDSARGLWVHGQVLRPLGLYDRRLASQGRESFFGGFSIPQLLSVRLFLRLSAEFARMMSWLTEPASLRAFDCCWQ
jgi:hypothetical protein